MILRILDLVIPIPAGLRRLNPARRLMRMAARKSEPLFDPPDYDTAILM